MRVRMHTHTHMQVQWTTPCTPHHIIMLHNHNTSNLITMWLWMFVVTIVVAAKYGMTRYLLQFFKLIREIVAWL